MTERLDRGLDRRQLVVVETAEAVGEPGRSAGADASQQAFSLVREGKPDAAAVAFVADAREEDRLLEPVDVSRERGSRDSLFGGELAQAHPGVLADEPEQCDLATRDPELLGLLPQLA